MIDCRTFWPPSFGGEGESCDCTICVTAEQHNQGSLTIQQAVNQLLKTGGTVCLGPGVFNLAEKPVVMNGAFAVRVRGQGAATVVIAPRASAAFIISGAQWCTLDYFTIHTIASTTVGPTIQLGNSVGTTIERLIIGPPTDGPGPLAGVLLDPGFLLVTKIRDNFVRAQSGVAFAPGQDDDTGTLLLGGFYCEHNLMQCSENGIALSGSSYYTSDTVLARNFIFGTGIAGISATGFAFPELEIRNNTITPVKGDGIVVGTGGVRISDNRIANLGNEGENGIRLVQGLIPIDLSPIVVSGNRFQGLRGNGLSIETLLVSALVEGNVFNAVEGNGIIMQPGSVAGSVKVLGNELINIAVAEGTTDKATEIAAILLRGVFEGAVSDNAISGVGINSPLAAVIAGIRVENSLDVRVSDNSITNVAPVAQFSNSAAGILVVGPIVNVEIADNLIKRQISPNDDESAPWQAIRIAGLGAASPTGLFRAFDTQSNLSRVSTVNAFVAAAVPQNEQAGINDNSLHGYGRSPLAEVLVTGSCRFSGNHCACTSQKVQATAVVTATTIIAAENRVECGRNVVGLDLKPTNEKAITILGNIAGGPILINGHDLSNTPWQPLNIIGA